MERLGLTLSRISFNTASLRGPLALMAKSFLISGMVFLRRRKLTLVVILLIQTAVLKILPGTLHLRLPVLGRNSNCTDRNSLGRLMGVRLKSLLNFGDLNEDFNLEGQRPIVSVNGLVVLTKFG